MKILFLLQLIALLVFITQGIGLLNNLLQTYNNSTEKNIVIALGLVIQHFYSTRTSCMNVLMLSDVKDLHYSFGRILDRILFQFQDLIVVLESSTNRQAYVYHRYFNVLLVDGIKNLL